MANDAKPHTLLGLVMHVVGLGLFAYMTYATLFGPYKTTVVHLAIFAVATLSISFLGRERSDQAAWRAVQWVLDLLATASVVSRFLCVISDYERLLNLWVPSFMACQCIRAQSVTSRKSARCKPQSWQERPVSGGCSCRLRCQTASLARDLDQHVRLVSQLRRSTTGVNSCR